MVNCCYNCVLQCNVRIIYLILLGAIFIMPILLTFDTYLTIEPFTYKYVKIAQSDVRTHLSVRDCTIVTPIFQRVISNKYKYDDISNCLLLKGEKFEATYEILDTVNPKVYINNVVDDQIVLQEVIVRCVSIEIVDSKNWEFEGMYTVFVTLAWSFIMVFIVIYLQVCFFCSNWCSCICRQEIKMPTK